MACCSRGLSVQRLASDGRAVLENYWAVCDINTTLVYHFNAQNGMLWDLSVDLG
jgi:hypothetical protein